MDAQEEADGTGHTHAHGPRTQAEREAATVEIAFALFSAGVLAALAFLAVASPTLFGSGSEAWLRHAQWVGSSVFILRVVWVLLKWRHRRQPSQPGRTRPDS
ncbi:DUF6332 family protein [Streptomyces sp. TR06-5]|uniref:DUF6332 family protein n=1 Tax=unclassified Streptomyces TaxID=2593676 RepID=UPI0039A1A429